MLSVPYFDQITWYAFAQHYNSLLCKNLVIVFIQLMLSVSLSPNVIKLSGFNRKSKFDKIVIARVLPKFGKSCANVQALFETQATSDRISQQQKKN
jgi:hypothetical protein